MSGTSREDLDAAVALLARALAGELEALEIGGLTWIPRPQRARAETPARRPASAPPAAVAPAPAREPALASSSRSPSTGPAPARLPVIDDAGASPDDALAAVVTGPGSAAERLERVLTDVLGDCRRCKLHRGRSRLVYGVGDPEADLVFVGEGPGGDEDRQGIPFVGRAGQLLTRMIEAMGLQRDDVYICNVVKCRPPNNRDPEADEVEACERFLKAQLAIVQPKVIVTLGRHAAQTLLRRNTPITRLRGRWASYEGVPLLPTYHPAFLLREPARKREAWSDLQEVMKHLGLQPSSG